LKQILANLKNLDKSLQEFRAKQEKALDAENDNLKGQMINTGKRINSYAKMKALAASKAIEASHYMKFLQHEITHFNAEKGRKEKEQKMFAKLCDFQKKVHKKEKQAFTHFMKTIAPYLFNKLEKLAAK